MKRSIYAYILKNGNQVRECAKPETVYRFLQKNRGRILEFEVNWIDPDDGLPICDTGLSFLARCECLELVR